MRKTLKHLGLMLGAGAAIYGGYLMWNKPRVQINEIPKEYKIALKTSGSMINEYVIELKKRFKNIVNNWKKIC